MNTESKDPLDHEIEQRIKDLYGSIEAPEHLVTQIQTMVDSHHSRRRPAVLGLRSTAWVISGGAVVALSLVVAILALLGNLPPDRSPPYAQTTNDMSLSDALVSEFATFVASGRRYDITSTDPVVLKSWFRARMESVEPALPPPPLQATLQLAGGRICQIRRNRVASYMYSIDATLASLYVTRVDSSSKDSANLKSGELSISVQSKHAYASWIRHGWQYTLVAELPSERIAQIALMMSNWQLDQPS